MNPLAAIGAIVVMSPVFFALAILAVMWRAWWLYPAWRWFIVPLGMPDVSFWHFTALLVLVSVLTAHRDTKKDERKTDWASLFITPSLGPVIAWALLWWIAP